MAVKSVACTMQASLVFIVLPRSKQSILISAQDLNFFCVVRPCHKYEYKSIYFHFLEE